MLARAGIGKLIIVDSDCIEESNINRQIYALHSTIGMKKVDVAEKRLKDINPDIEVVKYDIFAKGDNIQSIISEAEYIIDCIDSIDSKVDIIKCAKESGKWIISSMSTGNKLEPQKFQIADISKTRNCPIAKIVRKKLKDLNITDVKVIYSEEENKKIDKEKKEIATISFVPSVAGILLAKECIMEILK